MCITVLIEEVQTGLMCVCVCVCVCVVIVFFVADCISLRGEPACTAVHLPMHSKLHVRRWQQWRRAACFTRLARPGPCPAHLLWAPSVSSFTPVDRCAGITRYSQGMPTHVCLVPYNPHVSTVLSNMSAYLDCYSDLSCCMRFVCMW